MPTSRLPLDVKKLLTEHFDSVAQLEMLFLFHDDPKRRWNAQTISRELRSNPTIASKQLQKLAQHGFITAVDSNEYIYGAAAELAEVVSKVHAMYAERPVAIISFLYEKPTDTLKGFADAFKLKKD